MLAVPFSLCASPTYGQKEPSAVQIGEWRKAADLGDAEAQSNLGTCYAQGSSMPKNEVEASKWYRKSAEQGIANAQYNLGNCYRLGEGVPKDEIEAAKWFRKAGEQGDVEALFMIGSFYAAGEGLPKDLAEAAKWYRKAADLGHPDAQFDLGQCYEGGKGVPQDSNEAVKWYLKAADLGLPDAQVRLTWCYDFGIGVTKNEAQAAMWYRKMAEQGDAQAQFSLGLRYGTGRGVLKDEAETVKWCRKAAEQGNARAQYYLGLCYYQGRGIVKNEIESYKWSLLAAAQGEDDARKNAVTSEQELSATQRAEGQQLAQEWEVKHANRGVVQEAERSPAAEIAGDKPKATGTGFLITRNGYLVTNHHVVKGTQKVRVQTTAGLLDAEIVRVDAASDLALLKVTGAFDALPVVSSRTARLGAMVATVGFPNIGLQGFEPKLSKGDISSLAGIQDDVRYFQISVPVQPGNSGGALVDEHGNVVGVVSAQLSQKAALDSTGTLAQSVNYAVKSSYLLSFLEAVPEASAGMPDAKTNEQEFESVVDDVKKATVLIIGY